MKLHMQRLVTLAEEGPFQSHRYVMLLLITPAARVDH